MKTFFVAAILVIGSVIIRSDPRIEHSSSHPVDSVRLSFVSSVAPLLVKNCQPCHYPGGKVFKKLPFENYLTVKKLGLKLNTRFQEAQQKEIVKKWVEAGSPKD